MENRDRAIIDISRPLSKQLGYWPGDTQFELSMPVAIRSGANINVGAITMSLHFGTHVDAPFHFDDNAATVDQLDIARFVGPAQVIDATGSDKITIEHFAAWDFSAAPRVLVKTGIWPESGGFPATIPEIDSTVADFLGEKDCLLFGIDLPSVDLLDNKDLRNHKLFQRNNIQILESIFLGNASPGIFELIAAPLKISGADAAPCRAILRQL